MGNYWKIKIGKPNWGAKGHLRKGDDLVRMTRMTPVAITPNGPPGSGMVFVVLSNMNCRRAATGIRLTSSLPCYDVWQPDKQDLKAGVLLLLATAVCSLSTRARLSVNQGRNHLTESRGYQCQSQPATMPPSEDIQKEAWMVQGHHTRDEAPWQETLEWQTYTWISRRCRQSRFHSRSVFPARDQVNDHQIRQQHSYRRKVPVRVSSNYADQYGKPFSASGFLVSILITRKLVMTLDQQYKGFPVLLVPPFEVEGPEFRRWWHP
ncbi:hypothetical protein QR685DRAFT_569525 [Neurospora intermedia]|uniref:Uncharacterized protein n=1 Tax=Neurospora intermedia TaxID=5142 RepID=A0ABR3DNJ5_NEUIN